MKTKKPRVSRISDVAALAGVSVATASKALNRGVEFERLSAACVERVERAARQLNYKSNYHAH